MPLTFFFFKHTTNKQSMEKLFSLLVGYSCTGASNAASKQTSKLHLIDSQDSCLASFLNFCSALINKLRGAAIFAQKCRVISFIIKFWLKAKKSCFCSKLAKKPKRHFRILKRRSNLEENWLIYNDFRSE